MAITAFLTMAVSCVSSHDPYLRTLRHLKTEIIEPVDSIDVDDYEVFHLNNVVPIDDNWLLMSSTKGDYNLMFLNTETSERFFAIRRGRGPGEIVHGNSLSKSGESAIYYDYNGGVCISINLMQTIKKRCPVLDTVGIFRDKVPKPVYIGRCGKDGFISGNVADENVWYSFFDPEGNVLSDVPALNYNELPKDRDYKLSFLLSSKYVSNPAGTKICVANVACPSLSFSNVDSGLMTEYKRYEIAPPEVGQLDSKEAFHGLFADEEFVYALYSGYMLRGDALPGYTCNHLIVYDWDGCPVKHYRLSRNISSIHVEGNCLTGSSDYPECKVYKYVLNGLR